MSVAPLIFLIDPEDPRAPSQERWEAMAPWERARLVEALPAEVPEEWCMPEGDLHSSGREEARDTLREFFRRQRRKAYISGDLNVYYPGEPLVAPDVFCVLGAADHPRSRWVVSAEGKGLDWALEVRVTSSLKRELIEKSELYARLGIPEYFVFDRESDRLHGFRFPSGDAERYEPIEAEGGRLSSAVLGLDLVIEEGRLRFYAGTAALPSMEDRIRELERFEMKARARLDEALQERLRAEREWREAELARAQAEAERQQVEAERAELARRLRELEAKLAERG